MPAAEFRKNGTKRILIVDDDLTFLEQLAGILHDDKYEILLARSGADAVQIIEKFHSEIDLAIIDLILPGELTGFDLIGLFTRKGLPTRLLAISGVFKEPQIYIAERAGADATIAKPAEGTPLPKELWLETVRELLGETGGAAGG